MARKQLGFTLIELLVTVSLSVILMMVATSVLITFMTGSVKNTKNRRIKNEGDHAMNLMKQQLQNSLKLTMNSDLQECESDMKSIAFRSLDGGITEFLVEKDSDDNNKHKIASNSGKYLTSGSVDLINLNTKGDAQYINFKCVSAANGPGKHITIKFGLRKGNPSLDRAYEVSEQHFTAGVTLRNY
ncbi:MAG: prepilin-type N-terminal cleavage/methylation domain-containing protein [Patescibacteria group bacterium]